MLDFQNVGVERNGCFLNGTWNRNGDITSPVNAIINFDLVCIECQCPVIAKVRSKTGTDIQ